MREIDVYYFRRPDWCLVRYCRWWNALNLLGLYIPERRWDNPIVPNAKYKANKMIHSYPEAYISRKYRDQQLIGVIGQHFVAFVSRQLSCCPYYLQQLTWKPNSEAPCRLVKVSFVLLLKSSKSKVHRVRKRPTLTFVFMNACCMD